MIPVLAGSTPAHHTMNKIKTHIIKKIARLVLKAINSYNEKNFTLEQRYAISYSSHKTIQDITGKPLKLDGVKMIFPNIEQDAATNEHAAAILKMCGEGK